MDLWEAVKALQEGFRVASVDWQEGLYIYLDSDGCFRTEDNELYTLSTKEREWVVFDEKGVVYTLDNDLNFIIEED